MNIPPRKHSTVLLALLLFLPSFHAGAQSGVWLNAGSDWNTGTNWDNGSVPSGLANFSSTVTVSPNISTSTTIIRLATGASSGTFSLSSSSTSTTLTLTGTGTGTSSALTYGDSGTMTVTAPLVLGTSSSANTQTFRAANAAGTLDISGVLSSVNSPTFSKEGPGLLILSGDNTYSGSTTILAGSLRASHVNALGTTGAGTSVTSGAALQLSGGITWASEALTLNGTGTNSTTGALRNISGDNAYTAPITFGSATRINSDSGTLTLSNSSGITDAGLGLTVGGAGNTAIHSTIDTTTGTLTKDGAGTLTLTTSNSFSGGTSISGAGQISLVNAHALGSGPLTFAGNSKLDNTSGGALAITNALTLSGGGPTYVGSSDKLTISGTTTISGAGRTITVDASDLVISGDVIDDGNSRTLTKAGAATLTLSASNSFGGGLVLSAGTVNLNHAYALGTGAFSPSASTTVNNTSGAAITLSNNVAWTLNNITFGGSNNLTFGTGSVGLTTTPRTVTLNGTAALAFGGQVQNLGTDGSKTLTVNGAGNTLHLNAGIALASSSNNRTITLSGTGNINVTGEIVNGGTATASILAYAGTGTLTLGTSNSYGGATLISNGTVKLGNAFALGASTGGAIVSAAGTLDLNGQAVSSEIMTNSGFLINTGGSASWDSRISFPTNTIPTVDGSGNITLLGEVVTQAVDGAVLTKNGTGTLTFSGTEQNANLNMAVNSGTVIFNKTSVRSIRGSAGLVINGGLVQLAGTGGDQILDAGGGVVINGGTFDLNSRTETVSTLQIGGTGSGTVTNSTGTTNVLTSIATIDGRSGTASAVLGGTNGLTKSTTGTLTLSAANTYTGNTTVNEGVLRVATGGLLRFTIGGSGTNNALLGTGSTVIEGQFAFNLAGASTNTNATWTIVANTLSNSYGTNFFVTGFSGVAGGNWTNTTNGVNYVFAQSNGVLSVQSTNAANNYTSWVSYWQGQDPGFTNTAGTADPDGDGFDNSKEYAFDGNPTIGSPALLTATKSGTNSIFNFVARKNPPGGVTYQVQSTANLATGPWTNSTVTVSNSANQTGINIPSDYERKEFEVPVATNQFYRVNASIAP